MNFVARRADCAVGVSRFIADMVLKTGIPPERVHSVVNGVNLSKFHPTVDGRKIREEYGIRPDELLVLQMGRIQHTKRQEDVVRAFGIASRKVSNLRCLIVGWETPGAIGAFPSYKAKLEHICKEEGLGDRLIIAPARPEAPELMAAADIVVMPSLDDPCPLVVTEAMSAGKPVIGADSGGITELIADGVTGFLAPPASPEAFAEKMILLAENRNLTKTMGASARRRAETNFDEERLASEFAPIYEGLVTRDSISSERNPLSRRVQPQP